MVTGTPKKAKVALSEADAYPTHRASFGGLIMTRLSGRARDEAGESRRPQSHANRVIHRGRKRVSKVASEQEHVIIYEDYIGWHFVSL